MDPKMDNGMGRAMGIEDHMRRDQQKPGGLQVKAPFGTFDPCAGTISPIKAPEGASHFLMIPLRGQRQAPGFVEMKSERFPAAQPHAAERERIAIPWVKVTFRHK